MNICFMLGIRDGKWYFEVWDVPEYNQKLYLDGETISKWFRRKLKAVTL